MSKAKTDGIKLIANNKKARHDYFVEDSFEAGIVLHGTEVKSLRQGHCSIKESFVDIDNGEVFIHQRYSYMVCISALMKKEISSTKIHFVQENYYCINRRFPR